MQTTRDKLRPVRIRAAQMEDAGRLAALSGQLGYPSSIASVRRRLRNLLADPEHAVWVAENESGAIGGWIHVFIKHLLESDREAEIGGLVVDQDFRGQGAGKALVERAERWAKSKRMRSVYVRSNIIRKDAHIFYQKLGYKIIKTQSAFRKELH
ncbi:MAG TPA: GNAT family N-acetyltransferase [Terriglobia bacterium]|nr:GNAT family N-acetyltransferase [Terriglobia bacterium]